MTAEPQLTLKHELYIPARQGGALRVAAGDYLDLIDPEGQQVGDLIAYVVHDPTEYFSPTHTVACLASIAIHPGDELWSNRRRALFRIISDDVGRHDIIVPCCDRERYIHGFNMHDHASCLDNLRAGLTSIGSAFDVRGEMAWNFFMNNVLQSDGRVVTHEPTHGAGATMRLECLDALVVAVSACPQDLTACNAYNPTALLLRVWSPTVHV
jgi:hypothetical protein